MGGTPTTCVGGSIYDNCVCEWWARDGSGKTIAVTGAEERRTFCCKSANGKSTNASRRVPSDPLPSLQLSFAIACCLANRCRLSKAEQRGR